MSLVKACQGHAQFRRSALATIDGEVERNWGEFVDRTARAATGFADLGVKPGDRVGILALNGADYLVSQVAVWWIGAVVVPMNIRWSAEENIYSTQDSGLSLLVVDSAFTHAALAIRKAQPEITLVSLDVDTPNPFISLEGLISASRPAPARDVDSDDLAGIYYTGGTTGFPKGVMLTHGALVAASMELLTAIQASDQSRTLHTAPMFHLADGAIGHAMLMVGACNIYVPRFEAASTLSAIERHRATHVMLVPTMIGLLLSDPAYNLECLKSLQTLCFGGSPMNGSLLAKLQSDLPNLRLMNCFGQTEMGPLVSFLDPQHQRPGNPRSLSIGKPFPSVDLKIVDDNGNEVKPGEPGEILARGPSMMRGYWNKPDETDQAIVDGWIKTGDIAFIDEDGFMFICDRAKDMIITGGENVFSAEVENAIAAHTAVAQVAVIGIPDSKYGERVHAVIVLSPDQTIDQRALFEHCRGLIANYKCPRSIELRTELPISGAGKVLKRDLRAPYWEGKSRGVN